MEPCFVKSKIRRLYGKGCCFLPSAMGRDTSMTQKRNVLFFAMEKERKRKPRKKKRKMSNNSWPTYSKDIRSPLVSLSTCYVNLQRGCDFQNSIKVDNYLRAWKNPASGAHLRLRMDPIGTECMWLWRTGTGTRLRYQERSAGFGSGCM